jgi:hypothetical protein
MELAICHDYLLTVLGIPHRQTLHQYYYKSTIEKLYLNESAILAQQPCKVRAFPLGISRIDFFSEVGL